MTEITPFSGFYKSIENPEYQQYMDSEIKSVFGNNKTLTLQDFLSKDSIFSRAFKKANQKNQDQINNVLNEICGLDGNSTTISAAEYKTLLAAMDAETTGNNSPMQMDGKFTINNESNGIYSLESAEYERYHRMVKWQKMSNEELLNELSVNVQNVLNSDYGGKGNNTYKLHEIITMASIYNTQSKLGKSMTFVDILKACLGDDILEYYSDRDKFPKWKPDQWSRDALLLYFRNTGGYPTIVECSTNRESCDYTIKHPGDDNPGPSMRAMGMNWSRILGHR